MSPQWVRYRNPLAIVDDDPQLVRTYELLFKHRKVPVSFIAYDSYTAIDKLKKSKPRPEVVIIDYRMPFMNGLDLMLEFLKLEPETRIIFISADDSVRQVALEAGVDLFLKKPTTVKDIMNSIALCQETDATALGPDHKTALCSPGQSSHIVPSAVFRFLVAPG